MLNYIQKDLLFEWMIMGLKRWKHLGKLLLDLVSILIEKKGNKNE